MQRYDNLTFMMCLPRSRSAWLSTFLKPVAWTMHDPLKQCASVEELGSVIDDAYKRGADHVFVADTAAVLFSGDLGWRFPNAKYLFVERDPKRVNDSLRRAGMNVQPHFYDVMCHAYRHALLVSKARSDLMLEVPFDDIDKRLLNIWRFVGSGNLLNAEYAERMKATNVQIPFDEQLRNTDTAKVRRLLSRLNLNL
jgi:hypothetical protein